MLTPVTQPLAVSEKKETSRANEAAISSRWISSSSTRVLLKIDEKLRIDGSLRVFVPKLKRLNLD
jgi:hypothetical protein